MSMAERWKSFNRRHRRVTQIEDPRVVLGSHVIAGVTDWWAKYGKEHPEWFAMRADGERGLKIPRAGAWSPLCVSNPELHRCDCDRGWDGGDVLTLRRSGCRRRKHVPLPAVPGVGWSAAEGRSRGFAASEIHAPRDG